MERKERAVARLGVWGQLTRLALLVMGTVGAAGVAHAAQETGCAAVNSGALNIELEAEGSATRQVELKAGDRLTFTFESAPGPLGSLTLRKGAGSTPRSLLVGPTGTTVSFVAAKTGIFDLEFAREGAEAAAFTASCTPASSARNAKSAAVSRRSARLFGGGTWNDTESLEAADTAGVVIDAGAPTPSRGSPSPPWAAHATPIEANALAHAGGVDMKMQWRGERYRAGGPDGFEIDNSASGIDAEVKYKVLPDIMVGALAQVDQANETLIGGTHSLFEQAWMAGPVTNVKLAPGLTLDARAAWGLAESMPDELSPHTVSLQRRLVSARLANTQSYGPWRLTPSVSVNHFYETAAAPATHDAAVSSGTGFGRVDVGPELAYRVDLDKTGFIEPRAVVGTFWDFDSLSRLSPGAAGHNDMRLRAEAGVTIGATDGTKLQAAGGVEEGEPGTANVWSGRLQLSVPMQ